METQAKKRVWISWYIVIVENGYINCGFHCNCLGYDVNFTPLKAISYAYGANYYMKDIPD